MRRLYLQIYLAILGIILLFTLLTSLSWFLAGESRGEAELLDELGAVVGEVLPGPGSPVSELQTTLDRLAATFRADFAVRGRDGGLLAAAGKPLPEAAPGVAERGWIRTRGDAPMLVLRLPDGRWFAARHQFRRHRGGALKGAAALGLLALAVGVGAYPMARRLTRRLERLQTRVDELGEGDLSARVEVEGKDEVADLARSFNRAADRIQRLVGAQRNLLASASHELRSPLARIRVGLELLAGDARPELRQRLAADIGELDDLIGEILLASRLDAVERLSPTEDVDLLALLAEEAARVQADVSGTAVRVQGDGRMLRCLIRNLLENARRHGGGSPIEVSVTEDNGDAVLRVADRGPGVPDAERERIFEPFYRPAGARETQGGVGLGLSLVRQIARKHGGDVRSSARDGGGSIFEVRLPL